MNEIEHYDACANIARILSDVVSNRLRQKTRTFRIFNDHWWLHYDDEFLFDDEQTRMRKAARMFKQKIFWRSTFFFFWGSFVYLTRFYGIVNLKPVVKSAEIFERELMECEAKKLELLGKFKGESLLFESRDFNCLILWGLYIFCNILFLQPTHKFHKPLGFFSRYLNANSQDYLPSRHYNCCFQIEM